MYERNSSPGNNTGTDSGVGDDAAEPTLYERLGGEEAISAVVDAFYERVLDDGRVSHFFQGTDMQEQRTHMTSFIASTAGGPVEYTGEEMEAAHENLVIRQEHFAAIAELLDETLREFDVPEEERNAVLEAVASYEDDVVNDE